MAQPIPQVMSPSAPAFANPPGFAPMYAIPELEASFALVTDRIHYQSGQEELTAQRVTLEANLQQEYRDRELLLHQELNYHMTSNAQAQSLLSAERALHEETLDNHTARWQQVLDMTTKGAEEEIEQERTQNVELALNLNDLRLQLQEAETQLKEWSGMTGMTQESLPPTRNKEQERKRSQEPLQEPLQNLLCPQLQ